MIRLTIEQMDSGGPVLWQNPTTKRFVLVGIISMGSGCGDSSGINTRVGPYIDWIVSETAGSSILCIGYIYIYTRDVQVENFYIRVIASIFIPDSTYCISE